MVYTIYIFIYFACYGILYFSLSIKLLCMADSIPFKTGTLFIGFSSVSAHVLSMNFMSRLLMPIHSFD